jgi:hypothetical protein
MIYRGFMRPIVVLCSLWFAACDVGSVLEHAGGDGGGSGSGSGSGSDDPATACGSAGQTAPAAHMHATGGTSNAGMPCLASGCHGPTPSGPAYSYAGTVYEADKTTPKPAATIFIFIGGKSTRLLSDMGGNFYAEPLSAAAPSNTMAASTTATLCPTIQKMNGGLVGGGGNCNSSSCHAAGAQGPIHL